MEKRDYPGYPEIVVIALPKCGTKTLNKCFTNLGYKVFDVQQLPGFSQTFDDYGKQKIEFAEMAKTIWEENEYDVIIEPSGLYWTEMADHWQKTKFINLVRDVESWQVSLKKFVSTLYELPDDLLLEHIFGNSPSISPTAHHGLNVGLGLYSYYIVGCHVFTRPGITWESQHPWDKMLPRMYRLFMADVQVNAPKDRTLFNYNIKDGWAPIAKFLGLPDTGADFPHENKGADAAEFVAKLFVNTKSDYDQKVENELVAWMKSNGYEVKKIEQ